MALIHVEQLQWHWLTATSAKMFTYILQSTSQAAAPLFGETLSLCTANRQDEAKLDIRAQESSQSICYSRHEKEKHRAYNQRV